MRRSLTRSGFTLIELLVTISVVAILLALALPSFEATFRSNRVTTATNELLASLALARTEALKSARGGGVCASADGEDCNDPQDWNAGWIVWQDDDASGAYSDGDPVIRHVQAHPRLAIASEDALVFDSRGRLMGGGTAAVTIGPSDECPGSAGLRRRVMVGATGQVTVARNACDAEEEEEE